MAVRKQIYIYIWDATDNVEYKFGRGRGSGEVGGDLIRVNECLDSDIVKAQHEYTYIRIFMLCFDNV